MKKILFIVSTLNNGGAQRIISNIMMNLPEDWTADTILNDAENITYPYKGNIISLQIKPQLDKTKLLYQVKVFLKRLIVVWKYKRTGEYVACISALTSANVANVITGRKYCKVILSEHNYMSEDSNSGAIAKKLLIPPLIRMFYNYSDYVVTVSKGIAKDLSQNFGVKKELIRTIYNGYLISEIEKMATEPLSREEQAIFESDKVFLVTVGRLSFAKGQWHLIRALQMVKEKIPNVRLLILGEGELEEKLRNLILELDLTEYVVMGGFVKNPFKYIHNCNVFVFPSLYEGFGNVIIESFCCGVPCISTDFNVGAREIMAPSTDIDYHVKMKIEEAEYGLLCPVCDGCFYDSNAPLTVEEKLLAKAIIQMLTDDRMRCNYRIQGIKRAKDFNMHEIVRQWMTLCED